MPTKRITVALLDKTKVPAGQRLEFWDDLVPGFGVRLSKAGRGSFFVMYRHAGKQIREQVGKYPLTPLDVARDKARSILSSVQAGKAPSERRAAAKREGVTFLTVASDFLEEYARTNKRPRSAAEDRRILTSTTKAVPGGRRKPGAYFEAWHDRPVAGITAADADELVDRVAKENGGIMANRVLAVGRKMFNWARAKPKYGIAASPFEHVQQPTRERSRDRVLSDEELRAAWLAADADGLPFAAIVRLLILTAQRRDEIGRLAWSELDLDGATWTLPASRAKNDQQHFVPLSEAAVEILRNVPRIGRTGLVFPASRGGSGAWSSYSKAKTRLDAKMLEILRQRAQERGDDPADVTLPDWTLHDLRRTAASGMARMGFPPHVVEKLLNHVSGSIRGVAAVYNRHSYSGERRAAVDAWAQHVQGLLEPAAGNNVVALRETA